jgi:NAD-dependent SIR2 family protein deacetylase
MRDYWNGHKTVKNKNVLFLFSNMQEQTKLASFLLACGTSLLPFSYLCVAVIDFCNESNADLVYLQTRAKAWCGIHDFRLQDTATVSLLTSLVR